MTRQQCPTCERRLPLEYDHCPYDGAELLPVEDDDPLVGRSIDGRFVIARKIGQGGMGTVYVARQVSVGRDVALKILDPLAARTALAARRFLREAQVASRLKHPNIVTIYDFGQDQGGLLYIAMELLEGSPLSSVMEASGALAPRRAVDIACQVCDALGVAHAEGLVHRDLKPDNIFLTPRRGGGDLARVLDFGIVKLVGDQDASRLTATGTVAGTPAYMSPEAATGKEIDARSDLYSLGVILYELLTGRRPFEGDSPMAIMLQHVSTPAPDVRSTGDGAQISAPLADLVHRLLAKGAAQRPSTADEVKALLIAALAVHGDPALGMLELASTAGALEPTPPFRPVGLPPTLPNAPQFGPDHSGLTRRVLGWVGIVVAMTVVAVVVVVWAAPWRPGATVGDAPSQPPRAAVHSPPRTLASRTWSAVARREPLTAQARPRRAPASAPRTVPSRDVTLRSDPAGASVIQAGQVIGTTPADLTFAPGQDTLDLTLNLPGYASRAVILRRAGEPPETIALMPLPGEPAVRPHKVRRATSKPALRQTPGWK